MNDQTQENGDRRIAQLEQRIVELNQTVQQQIAELGQGIQLQRGADLHQSILRPSRANPGTPAGPASTGTGRGPKNHPFLPASVGVGADVQHDYLEPGLDLRRCGNPCTERGYAAVEHGLAERNRGACGFVGCGLGTD